MEQAAQLALSLCRRPPRSNEPPTVAGRGLLFPATIPLGGRGNSTDHAAALPRADATTRQPRTGAGGRVQVARCTGRARREILRRARASRFHAQGSRLADRGRRAGRPSRSLQTSARRTMVRRAGRKAGDVRWSRRAIGDRDDAPFAMNPARPSLRLPTPR